MKSPLPLLALVLSLFLSACGGPAVEKKILGSWGIDMGPMKMVLSFAPDHKWTFTSSGPRDFSSNGTWRAKDYERIIMDVDHTSIDAPGSRNPFQLTVVSVDDKTLDVKWRQGGGDDRPATFHRVEAAKK